MWGASLTIRAENPPKRTPRISVFLHFCVFVTDKQGNRFSSQKWCPFLALTMGVWILLFQTQLFLIFSSIYDLGVGLMRDPTQIATTWGQTTRGPPLCQPHILQNKTKVPPPPGAKRHQRRLLKSQTWNCKPKKFKKLIFHILTPLGGNFRNFNSTCSIFSKEIQLLLTKTSSN